MVIIYYVLDSNSDTAFGFCTRMTVNYDISENFFYRP